MQLGDGEGGLKELILTRTHGIQAKAHAHMHGRLGREGWGRQGLIQDIGLGWNYSGLLARIKEGKWGKFYE